MSFKGLGMGLGNLSLLSNAVSRSISAENFKGEKAKAVWQRMEPVPTAPGIGTG